TARTLAITVNSLLAQPSAFTVSSATVCQGQNSLTYTIPAVAGATGYTWAYSGTGHTISGTGTSVTVSFSNTATSGTLSVTADNACGSSTARTLAITVNSLLAQPSAFTASSATVCQGQNSVTYTIPAVAGATGYTWTYSGTGHTISGTGTSVTVSFSNTATSGTLSVTADNACGSSTARTLAITVNSLPTASLSGTTTITSGQSTNLSVSLTGTSPWSVAVAGTLYSSITASPYLIPVSPNATTTYALTSVSNACGTVNVTTNNTATVTVSQQSITTSINGSTTFCSGQFVDVGFTTTGTFTSGNVYTAQLSDAAGSFVSPINIGTLTSIAISGTITALLPSNTFTGTAYRIRVIASNPAITGNDSGTNLAITTMPIAIVTPTGPVNLPSGGSVTLSANTGTNFTYQWKLNNNNISGANSATYNVTEVGNYSVVIGVSGALCFATSNSIVVNNTIPCENDFYPILLSNAITTCPNENVVFRLLNAPNGYDYSWSYNNIIIPNEFKPILLASQAGLYKVNLSPNWYQVEPKPTHQHLNGMTFLNDYNGWIVGNNGTILRTENSGDDWNAVYSGATATLNDIHFTSTNTGWVAGDNRILKSSSGGLNWESITTSFRGIAVDFFDKNIGAVVGAGGNILRTTNEGLNWVNVTSNTSVQLNDVRFLSSTIVFAVGDGGTLIKSINGGQTWVTLSTGVTYDLNRVYFFNQNVGWIVGDNNTLLKTTDGGLTWSSVNTGITVNGGFLLNWKDIYFTNSQNGWLIDEGNTLVKTINGGTLWSISTRFTSSPPTNITINQTNRMLFSTNNQNAYIIGVWGAIVKSADAGTTWVAKNSSSSNALTDVHFLDDNNAITVGYDGYVLKSADKGKTWNRLANTGTGLARKSLASTHFISNVKGWTVDFSGNIFTTNDGGNTWLQQRTAGALEYLSKIVFVDANKGFAVGGSGLFLETANGGATWTIRNLGVTNYLMSIYFINSTTGWISGAGGLVLKTTDGGITWTQQTTNTTQQISTIFFVDNLIGWANINALSSQTIIKTTDGGITWNIVASTPSYVKYIYFKNASEGYISGGNGYLASTIDGGNTWNQKLQVQSSGVEINEIVFNSNGVGIAVGNDNTIFRYNPIACSISNLQEFVSNTAVINTVNLSGNTPISTPYAYKSNQMINSSQIINQGAIIDYQAKDVIDLQPGFDTKPQTLFKTELKGCNN
ncbi:MAG: YCF48-related protein, partial [Bacteroidota bacterium]